MNRICRQLAAVSFATGIDVAIRWVPSELNPADAPSCGRSDPVEAFDPWTISRECHADPVLEEGGGGWRARAFAAHARAWGKETPRPVIQEEQEDKKRKWATLRRYLHGQPEDQQKGPLTFLERKCRMRGRRAMRRVSGGSWSGRSSTQRSSYLSELFLGRGGPVGGADGGGRGEVPLAGCGEAHGVDAEHHCFDSGELPLPWERLCAICRRFIGMGKKVALWLMPTRAACGRPGEIHRLQGKHVVGPGKLCSHTVLIINPGVDQQVPVTSKAGGDGRGRPCRPGLPDQALFSFP